jgi:hypothetical protein
MRASIVLCDFAEQDQLGGKVHMLGAGWSLTGPVPSPGMRRTRSTSSSSGLLTVTDTALPRREHQFPNRLSSAVYSKLADRRDSLLGLRSMQTSWWVYSHCS